MKNPPGALEDNKVSITTNPGSKVYSEAAHEFIQQVRLQSSAAAACLEQIQSQDGSRAAYLAAFALIQLKRLQLERKYLPSQHDLHVFTFCEEMRDTAEAIRLYEQAAEHLLLGPS